MEQFNISLTGYRPVVLRSPAVHEEPIPQEFLDQVNIPRSMNRKHAIVLELVGLWSCQSAHAIAWSWLALHPDQDSMTATTEAFRVNSRCSADVIKDGQYKEPA